MSLDTWIVLSVALVVIVRAEYRMNQLERAFERFIEAVNTIVDEMDAAPKMRD